MRHIAFILLLCLNICLALPSHAAETRAYFTTETISPRLLTPPLTPHSPEWNAEVKSIISLQRYADAKEVAKADKEREMAPEMVALTVEPTWTRKDFPATYHLLDRVGRTTHIVGDNAKDYWHTKRPYLMDKRIKALVAPSTSPAYPSGHTLGSHGWAYTLALLQPAKRDAFLARAAEIAQHRVLVGMHYPHDVRGGKELALLIIGGLLQNAEFKADFQAARKELKAKGQLKTQ